MDVVILIYYLQLKFWSICRSEISAELLNTHGDNRKMSNRSELQGNQPGLPSRNLMFKQPIIDSNLTVGPEELGLTNWFRTSSDQNRTN